MGPTGKRKDERPDGERSSGDGDRLLQPRPPTLQPVVGRCEFGLNVEALLLELGVSFPL